MTAPHRGAGSRLLGPGLLGSSAGATTPLKAVFLLKRRPVESSQITSPLKGPVNFLQRWNFSVCEFAKVVGGELRAHSGMRRTETWKSLRIMSDKARVLATVRLRILFLAFEFVTAS